MERIERIKIRLYTLKGIIPEWAINDIDNLLAALAERDKELSAATRIVENQEAQIIKLAQEKEQAEARVRDVQADNIKKAEYIVAISMTCPDEYLASKIVEEAIEKTRNRYAELETALAHERQISDDVVKDNEILKGRIERLRDALGNIIGSCDCCHDRCDSCTIHIQIAKEAREG